MDYSFVKVIRWGLLVKKSFSCFIWYQLFMVQELNVSIQKDLYRIFALRVDKYLGLGVNEI